MFIRLYVTCLYLYSPSTVVGQKSGGGVQIVYVRFSTWSTFGKIPIKSLPPCFYESCTSYVIEIVYFETQVIETLVMIDFRNKLYHFRKETDQIII